tara:strand:+ start:63 stop:464 length:402 start_codon:yes stop_codon:yes gene_type:complete
MKKSGFKMKGMSFKEGQSPMHNLNEEAFKAAPPGSSKEELLEIAEDFVKPVKEIELDYGGEFDFDSGYSEAGVSKEEVEEMIDDSKEEEPKKKKKPKKKYGLPNWMKRKKKAGNFISMEDIKNMNKGAKFQDK